MPGQNNQTLIYVFFGLIAGGKSTLAQAWADHLNLACYNSDQVRKEMAGADGSKGRQAGFGQGLYSRQATEKRVAATATAIRGRVTRIRDQPAAKSAVNSR